MPQHGHERDARIDRRANPDPPRDETEDGVMDMEKKDEEAGEEKEEGEMEKRRQGFYSPGKMQLFDAFGEERADARTLVRAVSRAGDLDVSARPLMQQRRQERAGQAHSQAQEPERVDPDGVPRWLERGWTSQGGGDGELGPVGGARHQLVHVGEVEGGDVL